MRRARRLLILAVLVAGCGNEATPVPDVTAIRPPAGSVAASYPRLGLRFRVPANWRLRAGRAPLVATVASGTATIALWRYRRTEPLPAGRAALDRARAALVAAVRRRDGTFDLGGSAVTAAAGRPAIEVRGTETIAGERRRVRSVHVFARGAEVVVDAQAPPGAFGAMEARVLGPLLASLRVTRPRAR